MPTARRVRLETIAELGGSPELITLAGQADRHRRFEFEITAKREDQLRDQCQGVGVGDIAEIGQFQDRVDSAPGLEDRRQRG